MRIGILTFHGADNYGAVLQAYALNRTLSDLGADSFCINYRPSEVESVFRWNWKRGGLTGQNIVNQILTPKFRSFRENHLKLSENCYRSISEMRSNPPEMEAVVFGSDQIWNPGMFSNGLNEAYLGGWLEPHVTRIAYSASFGGATEFNAQDQARLKRWLPMFEAISVREESGADLVEQFTNSRPVVALDPTLLVEDYTAVAEPCSGLPSEYIFMYALQYSPEIRSAARLLSERTGLPIVMGLSAATGLQFFNQVGRSVTSSPGEWLWLINNAKVVVTNSFHGAVFSLIGKRRVLAVPLTGRMKHRNDRIINLFRIAGREAWVAQNESIGQDLIEKLLSTENWDDVGKRLKSLKNTSMSFLRGLQLGDDVSKDKS